MPHAGPGALSLETEALLSGHGLEGDGLHREPQDARRDERRAGAHRLGRQRLDLVEERQPLARGLAHGGPGKESGPRGREPARLREGRPPLRKPLGEGLPLRLQPVAAVLPVAQELGARAVALDPDAPRPGALGQHQHVAVPLGHGARVDAGRSGLALEPLPVDEVIAGAKVVAQDGRSGRRDGHEERGRRVGHGGDQAAGRGRSEARRWPARATSARSIWPDFQ